MWWRRQRQRQRKTKLIIIKNLNPRRTRTRIHAIQRRFVLWNRQKRFCFVLFCFLWIEPRRQARKYWTKSTVKIWFYCLGQSSLNCNAVFYGFSVTIQLFHTYIPYFNAYDGWFIVVDFAQTHFYLRRKSPYNINMCTGVRLCGAFNFRTHASFSLALSHEILIQLAFSSSKLNDFDPILIQVSTRIKIILELGARK